LNAESILYISIAAIISLIITAYVYGYKTKYTNKLRWLFGILRFITLFSILVLLINPKFKSDTYTIEKPKLPVLVDNSFSIASLNQRENTLAVLKKLEENEILNKKFEVSYFQFGSHFQSLDSISLDEKNTNISKALISIQEIFDLEIAPIILVSDGNQTLGTDYEYTVSQLKHPVYPVILGDSIRYTDLKIEQLTSNRYAFLKNKFPVEVVLVYSGSDTVRSEFIVNKGDAVVYREAISFSEKKNVHTVSLTLPAQKVGLQSYTAKITALDDEKNKINNSNRFAIEVIDQATNVLIVSSILHPDMGMLKKAITTNKQRTVTFKNPREAAAVINDYQLVILYQPNREFDSVYQELSKLKKNTFVFTGAQTDWSYLNTVQEYYEKEFFNQTEIASAKLNLDYGAFSIYPIGFDDFPPLQTVFGALSVLAPHQIILEQYIDGIVTNTPMLSTIEVNGMRHAIWDGQDIWKWRAQSYRDTQSFEDFDAFIGNIVQYLASNKRRSRLEVSNETFYYNSAPIKISAQYYDKNFVFDTRALLSISVVHQESKKRSVFPLLLKNNFFEADLNSLDAGSYRYTVSARDQEITRSGSFTILQFNIEQQFLNANIPKLKRLAEKTKGTAYFTNEVDQLINELITNQSYATIQKNEQKVVPLIFIKWLLGLIALSLAMEWFIRKFNGLI
jgi:hypothetical protein